ncbi:DMT family transporter [Nocardia transvalensis]|uniref:DMT family transporter n=1 Tax=Nocardia transvalensis TaxID=37333 RepID=UPI002B4B3951|nr:DMT family transporter [Nocardia transvalensis]
MTRWRRLGVAFGFCIGGGVAVQARINGALGERLQDGVAAAVVSFGSGLVLLVAAVAVSGRLREGVGQVRGAVWAGKLRWWELFGGLCGAFFVASQGLTVAVVGVAAFTVAVVAGQLVSSLVVDRLGLGPGGRTPVTGLRIVGAVLALIAVAVSALHGSAAGHGTSVMTLRGVPVTVLVLLPALAGIGLAWQQAVNGRVGAIGGPVPATLVNFAAGTVALLLVEAAVVAKVGWPSRFPSEPGLYLGGAIGVLFIALAALVVRWIGVLLLGLTSVAGQLIAAVVLDIVAPTGAGLSATAVIGCALTLVAVGVATRTNPAGSQ